MPKVSFDGNSRVISVLAGETSISVKTDIYSEWKNWALDNSQFPAAVRTIGGDPIGGGLFAGDLYFMINGWQVSIPNNNVNVEGALFHDDGIPVFVVDPGGSVVSTVSALVQTVETGTGGSSGSSLTKQDVRDAMALTSNLPPSNDSIDKKLDDIKTIGQSSATVLTDIQGRITTLDMRSQNIKELVEILLKYSRNRTRVDKTNNTLTVFDDDTLTPLRVFDLLDQSGNPSTEDISERIPQ